MPARERGLAAAPPSQQRLDDKRHQEDGGRDAVEARQRETVTHEITFSPSAVQGEVSICPLPDGRGWSSGRWSLRRDGQVQFSEASSGERPDDDDASAHALFIDAGQDDAAGEWTLVIDDLVGIDAACAVVPIPGPWEFSVTVPERAIRIPWTA